MAAKLLALSIEEMSAIAVALEGEVDLLSTDPCLCLSCRERLRVSRALLKRLMVSCGAFAPGASPGQVKH